MEIELKLKSKFVSKEYANTFEGEKDIIMRQLGFTTQAAHP